MFGLIFFAKETGVNALFSPVAIIRSFCLFNSVCYVLYEVRIESLPQISRRTNSKWFEFVRYGKGVGNLTSDY